MNIVQPYASLDPEFEESSTMKQPGCTLGK